MAHQLNSSNHGHNSCFKRCTPVVAFSVVPNRNACRHLHQYTWQAGLLVAVFFSPAHNADLMVGHGEGHLLLKDPPRVGVELRGDINATGDGASSMDLRPQLVCLSDLQSAHAE